MKQLILSLSVVLCTLQLTLAQDGEIYQMLTPPKKTKKVRYSALVEAMPYYGMHNWGKDASVSGLCIATSHGIQLVDKFFFGMGIGINIENSHIYVPYYYHFRLDLSKEQARPFISASLGFQIGCNTDTDSDVHPIGMWTDIMFGYQFKNRLYIAAGFTAQDAVYLEFLWGENKEIYGTLGMIAGIGIKF